MWLGKIIPSTALLAHSSATSSAGVAGGGRPGEPAGAVRIVQRKAKEIDTHERISAQPGQGQPRATVEELRAAIGLTRARLEAAYAYLLEYPLLGLTVMRQGDEFQLVTTGQVASSVERHLHAPRAVSLSEPTLNPSR